MGKMIIDNRSSASDVQALECAMYVMQAGRISNHDKQYCYLTMMTVAGCDHSIAVSTDLNKSSDRFVVTDYDDKYFKERSKKLNSSVKKAHKG